MGTAKKLLSALLALALMAGLLTMAGAAESGVKVRLTAQQKEDLITLTLHLQDVSFNGFTIALQYDNKKLTPVNPIDKSVAGNIRQATTILAPVYEETWDGVTGWFSSVAQGMKLDTEKGFLEYTFVVQPDGEGVEEANKCLTIPQNGMDIVQFHFKAADGVQLFYSDLKLLPDIYPENRTGVGIAGAEEQISDPAAVLIDLSAVAQPDPVLPPLPSPSDKPGDKPDDENQGSGNAGEQPAVKPGTEPEKMGQFPDTKGHWAASSIERLAGEGIISGYPNGNFGPEDAVSRCQMAVMLVRAYHLEYTDGANIFDDMDKHWAAAYVNAAATAGYFQKGGNFRPDDTMSREELAVVIARIEKLPVSGISHFTDSAACAPWSTGSVAAMEEAELLKGYPDGSFRPQDSVSRCQAAALLDRILK